MESRAAEEHTVAILMHVRRRHVAVLSPQHMRHVTLARAAPAWPVTLLCSSVGHRPPSPFVTPATHPNKL